ncbi:hypothetical protein BCR43DRAFT_488954 [Syncephalastrum racemosum]|uniref:Uncharacterized protein n=1 Tax=Syncephalastrum racemosum TaxID=13706 RepID=A0A1X2H5N8_SYNRA|nr:hypothetical protein BCR43DRAFT_495321 [Syncephalastrum racemosum]ORY99248.1 hypothetical protein BCR43DRAFT_488954 [Syncephalastrum racemosum]
MLKLYSHATGQRIRRFPWQVFDTRLAEGRYRTSSEPKLELSGFDFGEKVRRPDLLTEREKRRFHASLIQLSGSVVPKPY